MRKEGFAGKPIDQHPSSIIREKTDDVHPLSINGQLMKKDARIAELEAALKLMIDTQDAWEKGVSEVIGKQPNVFNHAIDAARKVLENA